MENLAGIKMFSADDLCKGFHIAKERKYITEDFFDGYYGIQMPQSIVPEEKVKTFKIDIPRN